MFFRHNKNLERIFLTALLFTTLYLLIYILYYSMFGFDFTDESFYINWVSNPHNYTWSISQFGFIYSPIYKLFHGNIIRIRQINIILTYFLSITFIRRLINYYFIKDIDNKNKLVLIFTYSSSCLLLFMFWLIFPNYNTLTFQGTIIFSYALLGLTNNNNFLDEFLICLGGWLVFMAKPRTAVILIVFSLIVFLNKRLSGYRFMRIVGLSIIHFIIGAFLIDKSISGFISRIIVALNFSKLDGLNHSFLDSLRIDIPLLSNLEYLLIMILVLFSFYIFRKIISNKIMTDSKFYIYLIVYWSFLSFIFSRSNYSFYIYSVFGILMPITLLLLYLIEGNSLVHKFKEINPIFYIFMLLPYATSFGSNNNYWLLIGMSSFFYLVSSLIIIKNLKMNNNYNLRRILYLVAVYYLILTLNVTNHAIENPYRQPSFDKKIMPTIELKNNNFLFADQTIVDYIKLILYTTNKVGFISDTPIIDLSGQSPGVIYLMNGKAIGQPWMIGGSSGSEKLAYESLKLVPCIEIQNSWLLIEPNGPRSINANILSNFGLDINDNYVVVAEWDTPDNLGGYSLKRHQFLLKPHKGNSVEIKNCTDLHS